MTTHRPVGPATPQETVASPAPETPPETAAPLEPGTPSWRSVRGWVIAALQTLLCLGLGCLMFVVVLGELLFEFDDAPPEGLLAMVAVDALIGVAATVVIGPLRLLRPGRLHATAHLLITTVAGLSVWSVPAAAIALYRLGLRRRLGLDVAAVVLLGVAAMAWLTLDMRLRGDDDPRYVATALGVMIVGALVPLLIGRVVGTRHELIRTLRERADAAERERASAERERVAAERERAAAEQARSSADQARRSAEQAGLSAQREADALRRGRDAESAQVRAEERAALARDMHDSVSHHLASIAMHAGAMAYREDLDPETLRRTARTVRDAAQHANRELREVLVALRTAGDPAADDAAPLATAPTLEETVERARDGGQEVSLELHGLEVAELEQLGRGTVVALARILGEALTNAAKHAPGAPVTALLARRAEQVTLTVENPLTGEAQPLSTGHGLIGVEERARLLGGGSRWTRTEHGTFEMEAWLPW
ncbi:histidine kinase [Brachybacterium paraconglomeratum]|uniref:histidine kinase n=1 Tax=Brachybacterium paraconglomeratum TaxID=173362 RepID=UPI0022B0656E|nr:histidine kinase [Brachybacterium paraconglomeratum]MCZ4325411.1 histidine kinase [Brachybacterium paraconglomeratum]